MLKVNKIYCGDCLEIMEKKISDLQTGKAGEYLVCADLITQGYIAFPSEQGLPFDVVAEVNKKLIKIQVKTTRGIMAVPQRKKYTPSYFFNIKRMGKGGKKQYSENDVDIFALVALDRKIIGYLKSNQIKQSMVFRIKEFKNQYHDKSGGVTKAKIKQLRMDKLSYDKIAEVLGVSKSCVYGICKGKKKTLATGRYLEDLTFDRLLKGK